MADEHEAAEELKHGLKSGVKAAIAIVVGWALGGISLIVAGTGFLSNDLPTLVVGLILLGVAGISYLYGFSISVAALAKPVSKNKALERAMIIVLLLVIAGAFVYGMVAARAFFPKLFYGGVLPPVVLAAVIGARWIIETRSRHRDHSSPLVHSDI